MVLGQPHRVHAAGLGFIHQCKTLGKGFLLTHPVTAGKLDKQPDLHARSPFSPRLRPLETLGYFLGCDGWYRNARPRQEAVLSPSRKLCCKPGRDGKGKAPYNPLYTDGTGAPSHAPGCGWMGSTQ